MLVDLFLKTNLIGRGGGGRKASIRSPFCSRSGTNNGESAASRSVYLTTVTTESTQSEQVPMSSQEPCSSRQAGEALSQISAASEESATDNLQMLKKIKADMVKKAN